MSRGPRSTRALEAALPIANRRGEVMFLGQQSGSCFDFITPGPSGPVAVRVDRALRIHGTPAGIAFSHAGSIDRMNAAALPAGLTRELWLWAPWGTMRFFRIEGALITELDMLGNVRQPLVKGALAGKMRPRWRKSRKKTGTTAEQSSPGPVPDATAGASPETPGMVRPARDVPAGAPSPVPGVPAPAGNTVREPAPVRYLRLRAAEMRRKKEVEAGAHPPKGPAAMAPGGDDHPPS